MKNLTPLLTALLLLSLLASCGKNTSPADDTTSTDTTVSDTTVSDENGTVSAYTVSEEAYTSDDNGQTRIFNYPVFNGTDKDDILNTLVFDDTKALMDNYLTYVFVSENGSSYDISPAKSICTGSDLASFFYVGQFYTPDAAHPVYITYSVNVDVKNGKLLTFTDIVKDFSALSELLRQGVFTLVSTGNDTLDRELNDLEPNDLLGAYSDLYGIYPNVYFTDESGESSLVLSFETIYALGGHAEFEAPLDAVSHTLTDNILNLLKGE